MSLLSFPTHAASEDSDCVIPSDPALPELMQAIHEVTTEAGKWSDDVAALHQHCSSLYLAATRAGIALRMMAVTPEDVAKLQITIAAIVFEALDIAAHFHLDMDAALVDLHGAFKIAAGNGEAVLN